MQKKILVVLVMALFIAGFATIPLGKTDTPIEVAGWSWAGTKSGDLSHDGPSQMAGLPVQFRGGNKEPVQIAGLPVAFRGGNNGNPVQPTGIVIGPLG
ncbi:MAG: hypothetical protein KC419_01220 [Anaerolineales bacterium]|nr:hypothetical protein [Anaerolineales bacterium]MCA9927058.1 hypothetical protein [Anaerolineales bacterium]